MNVSALFSSASIYVVPHVDHTPRRHSSSSRTEQLNGALLLATGMAIGLTIAFAHRLSTAYALDRNALRRKFDTSLNENRNKIDRTPLLSISRTPSATHTAYPALRRGRVVSRNHNIQERVL